MVAKRTSQIVMAQSKTEDELRRMVTQHKRDPTGTLGPHNTSELSGEDTLWLSHSSAFCLSVAIASA